MAISPTRSVTEQTADLSSPRTEIHSQSWQHALQDARHHASLAVTTLKSSLRSAVTSPKTAFITRKIPSSTSVPDQTSNTPQKPKSAISADKPNDKPKKAAAHHHHSTALITGPLTQNAQPVLPEIKPVTSPKPAHEGMDTPHAPVKQRAPATTNPVAIAEPLIPRAPTPAAAPTAPAQVQQQASPANSSPSNSSLTTSKTPAAASASSSPKTMPKQRASSHASTSKLVAERFATPAMANKPAKPQQPAQSPPVGGILELSASFQSTPASPTMPTSQEPVTATTATSAAALAATVTALHQAGQTGAILRLDPPGLGHLSVQIGQTTHGQINIMFVPSTADAAQILQNALPQLHQALSQSGLTLGQAQVGGEFSHSGGQGGQNGHNNPATPAPTAPRANLIATASTPILSGLSAYA